MKRNADGGQVSVSILITAFGLVNNEPALILEVVESYLMRLGSYKEVGVSRADVAVDFQGWSPQMDELTSGMVCAATYRGTHGNGSGVQTFQFGKGVVVVRLYDKTAEIAVTHKDYMKELWSFSDHYNDYAGVWRVEVQMRRLSSRNSACCSRDR